MNEQDLKHGVISRGKVLRKIRRAIRPQVVQTAGAAPFNWQPIVLPPLTIKNQFGSDSCGGQAASYWIELVDRKLSNNDIQFSAKSIYSPIAYPSGGTTVYALEQQVAKLGANFESDVPSYRPNGQTDEAFMTDRSYQTVWTSKLALRDAYRTAVSVPIDIESMACAWRDSGSGVMEVQGQNGNYPSWLMSNPAHPVKTNNSPIWAHFLCIVGAGIMNGQKVIAFANSWGDQIGQGGFQFLTEDYINSGYVVDVFTWYPNSVIATGGQSGWLWPLFEKFLHKFLA